MMTKKLKIIVLCIAAIISILTFINCSASGGGGAVAVGPVVDTTAPSVQLVTGPSDNTYVSGQNMDFSVVFAEVVTVTGVPRLILTIGSSTRYADYLSGSGTNTLQFRMALLASAGDADADGIAVAPALDLNGGTISDAAANAATLSFTAPNTAGVNVVECPNNYVNVPPSAPYTTAQFCVAKYEMKDVGSVATSQAAGAPWVNIDRNQSIAACAALGAKYSLISNAQWQTAARNIEGVAFNWAGATVGHTDGLSVGHSWNNPNSVQAASTDDNDCCVNMIFTCSLSVWERTRRVHQLSNGSYIWDMSGNAFEWVKDNLATDFGADAQMALITPANHPVTGSIGGVVGNLNYHFGPAGDYTAHTVYPHAGLGFLWIAAQQGTAIARGRSFPESGNVGIFGADLVEFQNTGFPQFGFRCVWTP